MEIPSLKILALRVIKQSSMHKTFSNKIWERVCDKRPLNKWQTFIKGIIKHRLQPDKIKGNKPYKLGIKFIDEVPLHLLSLYCVSKNISKECILPGSNNDSANMLLDILCISDRNRNLFHNDPERYFNEKIIDRFNNNKMKTIKNQQKSKEYKRKCRLNQEIDSLTEGYMFDYVKKYDF